VVEGFHQETRTIRKLLSGPIQHDYYSWGVRVKLKKGNCCAHCVEYVSRSETTRAMRESDKKKKKKDDTRAALPVIFPAFVASLS